MKTVMTHFSHRMEVFESTGRASIEEFSSDIKKTSLSNTDILSPGTEFNV